MPKGPRPPITGTCIFCQVFGLLEREHVVSEWMRDILHKRPAASVYRLHRTFRYSGTSTPEMTGHWVKPIATKRVRCVRHDCNHGWMKLLEERVKPLLGPLMLNGLQIIPVGKDQRRDLAAWAFKVVAVGQELPGNHIKPIDQGARTYLYQHLEPPPNVIVWIAPTPEQEFDGVIQLTAIAVGGVVVGYFGTVVAGRISLSVQGSFTRQPIPFQPTSVLGVEAIEIWPNPPFWSRTPTLPRLLSRRG
jgi:hypothetical protein